MLSLMIDRNENVIFEDWKNITDRRDEWGFDWRMKKKYEQVARVMRDFHSRWILFDLVILSIESRQKELWKRMEFNLLEVSRWSLCFVVVFRRSKGIMVREISDWAARWVLDLSTVNFAFFVILSERDSSWISKRFSQRTCKSSLRISGGWDFW